MTERSGVEIDYCPECRGVWLDRGELDKIIERAGTAGSGHKEVFPESKHDFPHKHTGSHKKKKPGSFLEDLFDF